MTSHGDVIAAAELEQRPDFKRDLASVLIVRDVRYRPPKWSWEIQEIMERSFDDLPADLALVARGWIDAVRDKL
jgi:hypothetical protein